MPAQRLSSLGTRGRRRSGLRQDAVELPQPFGQRRRAWLQDVRRFDFVDLPLADGGHVVPPHPRRDSFLPHGLPAPGRDDDLRVAAYDFVRRDDAVPPEFRVSQLREDRGAPRDLDKLLDPPDA